MARLLYDIPQAPELQPNIIPKGVSVEVVREVEHPDFFSGKGYLIFWAEKAYADVVDASRLHVEPNKNEIENALELIRLIPKHI